MGRDSVDQHERDLAYYELLGEVILELLPCASPQLRDALNRERETMLDVALVRTLPEHAA